MHDCSDGTAEAVIGELHRANAACNAADIARMRAIVRCDLKRVYRRDDSFDMARWLATELGVSSWKASRLLEAGYALDDLPLCAAAYQRGELSTDQFLELAVSRPQRASASCWRGLRGALRQRSGPGPTGSAASTPTR